MKNKKLMQLGYKQKHRELLRCERRTEPTFERVKPIKIEKPRILIVCEGKKTACNYEKIYTLFAERKMDDVVIYKVKSTV